MYSTSSSETVEKCKIVLTHMNGIELDRKLITITWVNKPLHAYFREVEEFIYEDDVPSYIEITVTGDGDIRTVVDERHTPHDSWGAEHDEIYIATAREILEEYRYPRLVDDSSRIGTLQRGNTTTARAIVETYHERDRWLGDASSRVGTLQRGNKKQTK